MNIKFITLYENQKEPNRAHPTDAGIDFFIPTFTKDFIENFEKKNSKLCAIIKDKKIIIYPHCSALIPSGIKAIIEPKDSALIAFNKSGISTKYQLTVGACVVDRDYTGEIHIHLINTSNKEVILEENQKIVQFVHLPVIYSQFEKIDPEDFNKLEKDRTRKDKGFGSTG